MKFKERTRQTSLAKKGLNYGPSATYYQTFDRSWRTNYVYVPIRDLTWGAISQYITAELPPNIYARSISPLTSVTESIFYSENKKPQFNNCEHVVRGSESRVCHTVDVNSTQTSTGIRHRLIAYRLPQPYKNLTVSQIDSIIKDNDTNLDVTRDIWLNQARSRARCNFGTVFEPATDCLLNLVELKDFRDVADNILKLDINSYRSSFVKLSSKLKKDKSKFSYPPSVSGSGYKSSGVIAESWLLAHLALIPTYSAAVELISAAQFMVAEEYNKYVLKSDELHRQHYTEFYDSMSTVYVGNASTTDNRYFGNTQVGMTTKFTATLEFFQNSEKLSINEQIKRFYGLTSLSQEYLAYNLARFSWVLDYIVGISDAMKVSARQNMNTSDLVPLQYCESTKDFFGQQVVLPDSLYFAKIDAIDGLHEEDENVPFYRNGLTHYNRVIHPLRSCINTPIFKLPNKGQVRNCMALLRCLL